MSHGSCFMTTKDEVDQISVMLNAGKKIEL